MFSDNETFFHDEKRHIETRTEQLGEGLGYLVSGRDPEGRYTYTKDIISDPHVPCLLQRTRVEAAPEILRKLKIYACLAPHIEVAGWGNNGHVVQAIDRGLLDAVLGVDLPGGRCWRRYNHDGYGQRDDGGPSEGFGRGAGMALTDGRKRALRDRRGAGCLRPNPLDGRPCHSHENIAGTGMGPGRSSARSYAQRKANRFGHSAALGACRIYKAATIPRRG